MKLSYDPKPGMLVRCVDGEFDADGISILPNRPVRGGIYTVRRVDSGDGWQGVGLTLAEVVNAKLAFQRPDGTVAVVEPCFLAQRFVPVDPKALDVFRKQSADA